MNDTYTLQANTRTDSGRHGAKQVRTEGLIPGILYGHGVQPTMIAVKDVPFRKILSAAGESSLIQLTVDDQSPVNVLVHDVQHDPLKHTISHVDFYQVRMDEKITAEVQLLFVGVAPAVKELGGTLVKSIDALTVECLPANLPHDIEVDISGLKTFEDRIRISDMKLPEGVEVKHDVEESIVAVEPPRSEAELDALNQTVVENVESVEVAGKKEEPVEGAEVEGEKTV